MSRRHLSAVLKNTVFPATSFKHKTKQGEWKYSDLTGRLTEIMSLPGSAALTTTMSLVRQAQIKKEPVAWISTEATTFFPPDAYDSGVDVESLVVIRIPNSIYTSSSAGRAADKLARSGSFGLIIVDLTHPFSRSYYPARPLPTPLQGRLLQLAEKHSIAMIFISSAPTNESKYQSLGSIASLRGTSTLVPAPALYRCTIHFTKDKRCHPFWQYSNAYRAPAGLR